MELQIQEKTTIIIAVKIMMTVIEVRAAVEILKTSIQQFGNEETFKLFYKLKAIIGNQLQYSYDEIKQ